MRFFGLAMLLLSGCGADDCLAESACALGSSQHYRFCNSGGQNCYYSVPDGQQFHCTTCGDCKAAQDQVAKWCAAAPANNSNTGSIGSMCSAAVTCSANSGTYQACASPTGTDCGFKTSDGKVFKCNGCADCNAASMQAADWCTGGSSSNNNNNLVDMAGPTSCDVTKQNCGSGMKCVGVDDGTHNVTGTCVSNGSVGESQSCVQQTDPTTYLDDCKAGFICDDHCRKICTADSQCTLTGQRCGNFFGPRANWGWCLPTCTPFASGSCPGGQDCGGNTDGIAYTSTYEPGLFYCKPTGTATAYTTCMVNDDCAAGLWCDGPLGVCAGICDASHPCPQPPATGNQYSGRTAACTPFANQNGAGYCLLK